MTFENNKRVAWACVFASAVAALLAGCGGGGDTARPAAPQSAAQDLGSKRLLAVAVAASGVRPAVPSASELLDWAQTQYPALFESGPQTGVTDYDGKPYEYRFYPATGNYLGVNDGEVFGLGPFTTDQLQSFGPTADYACKVFPLVCAGADAGTLAIDGPGLEEAGGDGRFVTQGEGTATATPATCVKLDGQVNCTSELTLGWSESAAERLLVILSSSYPDRGVAPGLGINGIQLAYSVFNRNGLSLVCKHDAAAGADCDFAALGISLNPLARSLTFTNTPVPSVAPGGGSVLLNGTLTY